MLKQGLIAEVSTSNQFFNTSSNCLTEEDSNFKPKEEMMTVAQHVQHAADTVHWFLNGAFADSFDMDFNNYFEQLAKVNSLTEARKNFKEAVDRALKEIESKREEEWQKPIKDNQVMPGAPRMAIFSAISEHTAHHRGALAVYSRLLGKTPKMPYGE
jgi:uncharacterized damage-inducible protein DinB